MYTHKRKSYTRSIMKDQGFAHTAWENRLLWKLKMTKAQMDKWKEKEKVVLHSLSSIINV
jgi:hypothetical protein